MTSRFIISADKHLFGKYRGPTQSKPRKWSGNLFGVSTALLSPARTQTHRPVKVLTIIKQAWQELSGGNRAGKPFH